MMSRDEVREWRDQEKIRIDCIVNPYHRSLSSNTLRILNAILQED